MGRLGARPPTQSTFSDAGFRIVANAVYLGVTVAISDAQFRIGVVGGAILLAASLTAARFCGSVSLPEKPDAPVSLARGGTQQIVEQTNASPAIYQDYLAKDAAAAGVPIPSYEEMRRKLPSALDERRQVLEVGDAPIDVAGLRLSAAHTGDALVLEIQNVTKSDLAYLVVTEPTPNFGGCASVQPLPFNAVVIAKGTQETRVECTWRTGIAIAVKRVETVEVTPLQAWYLMQVPPGQLLIDPRVARGHRLPLAKERCMSLGAQAVRSAVENGEIVWRDLVDFYARHRCQTYQFPATYRAFTADEQRVIPAT